MNMPPIVNSVLGFEVHVVVHLLAAVFPMFFFGCPCCTSEICDCDELPATLTQTVSDVTNCSCADGATTQSLACNDGGDAFSGNVNSDFGCQSSQSLTGTAALCWDSTGGVACQLGCDEFDCSTPLGAVTGSTQMKKGVSTVNASSITLRIVTGKRNQS